MFYSATFLLGIQFLRGVLPAKIFAGIEGDPPFSPDLVQTVIDYSVSTASVVPLLSTAVGLILLIAAFVIEKTVKIAKPVP